MSKQNLMKIARTVEHIVLISAFAAGLGFYFGNSYGSGHVDLKALKTAYSASSAQNTPQASLK